MRRLFELVSAAALALTLWGCGGETPVSPSPAAENTPQTSTDPDPGPVTAPEPGGGSPPSSTTPGPAAPPAVLAGAGDIGVCGSDGARQTAALLDSIDGIVFTTGDNAYSAGKRQEFLDCYDPFWGRHKARTRPSPGNHDYGTPGAADYFDYFGPNAGPAGRGYYSFMAGAWLVLSLNSNVPAGPGSAQLAWVRERLQSQPTRCAAAIWHHPLASSGPHGSDPRMREIWQTLMDLNADVVLTGHDHVYERFTPLDADGFPSANGIRQFVVGTGGAPPYPVATVRPGSEARASVWGVLKLTLRSESFDWEFVPVPGSSFRDDGSQGCR